MSYHVGESYEGVISGVTGFGIYVQLENTVEGLVRLATMQDDYYIYEEDKYRLVGERTRRTYMLGQRVRVLVDWADVEKREIDFILDPYRED